MKAAVCSTGLLYLRTGKRRFVRCQDDHLVAAGGGEQHALALHAAQFGGGQVGDDDDLFADQFFRRVVASDPGADLPLFGAEIDLQTPSAYRRWDEARRL